MIFKDFLLPQLEVLSLPNLVISFWFFVVLLPSLQLSLIVLDFAKSNPVFSGSTPQIFLESTSSFLKLPLKPQSAPGNVC